MNIVMAARTLQHQRGFGNGRVPADQSKSLYLRMYMAFKNDRYRNYQDQFVCL